MSTVTPLKDNVLLKPQKAEEKTETGIYIPKTASEEKPSKAIVVATGQSDDIPKEIKKDSVVIYKKYTGTEVDIDGEEHVIVQAEDILAVIS